MRLQKLEKASGLEDGGVRPPKTNTHLAKWRKTGREKAANSRAPVLNGKANSRAPALNEPPTSNFFQIL